MVRAVLFLLVLWISLGASQWKHYHITESFDINRTDLRLWVPVPFDSGYQRVSAVNVFGNYETYMRTRDRVYGADMLYFKFDPAAMKNYVIIQFDVAVRDRRTDFTHPHPVLYGDENISRYLAPTQSIRIDGVVAEYAARIVGFEKDPMKKARRIYDWVVDNMYRDPKVRGCGIGNAYHSLESGYLGGKCADVSAVFTALLRASGIPAREVFGIRIAPSQHAKAYGVKSENITTAQHCRAEFYVEPYGWIPADPADVTKLILVEGLKRDDPKVLAERERQFGSWEMNWMGYNHARDLVLVPRPVQYPLSIFGYPYAESGDEPLDYYDPKHFSYTITSEPAE